MAHGIIHTDYQANFLMSTFKKCAYIIFYRKFWLPVDEDMRQKQMKAGKIYFVNMFRTEFKGVLM